MAKMEQCCGDIPFKTMLEGSLGAQDGSGYGSMVLAVGFLLPAVGGKPRSFKGYSGHWREQDDTEFPTMNSA